MLAAGGQGVRGSAALQPRGAGYRCRRECGASGQQRKLHSRAWGDREPAHGGQPPSDCGSCEALLRPHRDQGRSGQVLTRCSGRQPSPHRPLHCRHAQRRGAPVLPTSALTPGLPRRGRTVFPQATEKVAQRSWMQTLEPGWDVLSLSCLGDLEEVTQPLASSHL